METIVICVSTEYTCVYVIIIAVNIFSRTLRRALTRMCKIQPCEYASLGLMIDAQ